MSDREEYQDMFDPDLVFGKRKLHSAWDPQRKQELIELSKHPKPPFSVREHTFTLQDTFRPGCHALLVIPNSERQNVSGYEPAYLVKMKVIKTDYAPFTWDRTMIAVFRSLRNRKIWFSKLDKDYGYSVFTQDMIDTFIREADGTACYNGYVDRKAKAIPYIVRADPFYHHVLTFEEINEFCQSTYQLPITELEAFEEISEKTYSIPCYCYK